MTAKLTNPQYELLNTIWTNGPSPCVQSYKPAIKLVEAGLAEFSEGKFGGSTLTITDKGRTLMAQ